MTDAPERIWLGRDYRYVNHPWIRLTHEFDEDDGLEVADYVRADTIPALIAAAVAEERERMKAQAANGQEA